VRSTPASSASDDFGEDFFVYCEDNSVIEPFKIFIQVKASEAFDKNPSDWTEYCDPFTVRNWILSNEMTVIIRTNLMSQETRYAVPEDECEYWDINYEKSFPIQLLTTFDKKVAEQLIWMARIRHYDRLVRLTLPNEFEHHVYDDIPHFRLFLFELLMRLGIFAQPPTFSAFFVALYKQVYIDHQTELSLIDSDDMTATEKLRYATCFSVIPLMLMNKSGHDNLGLSPLFLDQAACALVQFVIDAENNNILPSC